MSQPKARTIVALLAALLVVAVAYVAVIVVMARDTKKPEPTVTAYAHGRSVTVQPFMYCPIHVENERIVLDPADCDNSQSVTDLDVPPGYPLQLSLPSEIVDAPWQMVQVYLLPDGKAVQNVVTHRDFDAGARAVTVPSRPDPRLRLAGVEIQLPVPARDEQGNEGYVPHAIWSVRTAA